jgi:hypothetical protein
MKATLLDTVLVALVELTVNGVFGAMNSALAGAVANILAAKTPGESFKRIAMFASIKAFPSARAPIFSIFVRLRRRFG